MKLFPNFYTYNVHCFHLNKFEYYQLISIMISEPEHVYIGSYSDAQKIPSIYDLVTKDMTALKINIPLVNPSYVYSRNKLLYAVQECNGGRINVIDSNYQLKKTDPTNGNDPCHISMNKAGSRLVVSNYSSGSFIMYELKNGIPASISAFIAHQGSSINPDRQASPHVHCTVFTEDDRILFVADLGTDTVYWYTVKYEGAQSIVCEKEKCLKMTGCGPRHLAKGEPNQKLIYMTGELDSSIRILSYQKGKLQLLSAYRVSNNPSNYPSEVMYMNNTVFMGNRGDNYLILFDSSTQGILKEKFRFKVGEWPRHFNITRAGTIFVACQLENIVQRYKFQNGKVFQLGSLKISSPSCINFEE